MYWMAIDFMNFRHKDMAPKNKSFQRIICDLLAGIQKNRDRKRIYHVLILN
jgi:hypothetical protein